ncbi:hypothetical protein [Hyphobacterium sp.]|uniref:hypothetical protein n=1 Tax=Hyphobacterium sp. TaxID=2004662 RepID=UPI003747BBB4
MNRNAALHRKRPQTKAGVAFAPAQTGILVLAGGLFAIIQTFSTVTLACRGYYDWYLFNQQIGGSIIQAYVVFSSAISLYLLADILRPKRQRASVIVRLFQVLLVLSIVSVVTVQHGLLLPQEQHADVRRSIHLALERTFQFQRDRLYWEVEGDGGDPVPAPGTHSFQDSSPFVIKAGRLRCEVDAEVEALQEAQWRAYSTGAIPFAITDERH